MARPRLLVLLLVFAVVLAAPVGAHTRSETHSTWDVAGAEIRATFTIPDLEAKRLSAAGRQCYP